MKILLVEDHQESRHNLQRLIERRGHEVHAVGSAEEAKRALQEGSFPFLILDWMLPGQSGIELCSFLWAQSNGDEMFILLVTARADTEDLEQALAAGANDYLTKPLDIALLNVRLPVAERQIRDLAERNHARTALQESARTVTNILENTTDGFFSLNEEWNFTYLNLKQNGSSRANGTSFLGKESLDRISGVGRLALRNKLPTRPERAATGRIRSERYGREDVVRNARLSKRQRHLRFSPRCDRAQADRGRAPND